MCNCQTDLNRLYDSVKKMGPSSFSPDWETAFHRGTLHGIMLAIKALTNGQKPDIKL